MVQFFLTPQGAKWSKMLFKKSTFCNFLPVLGLTSNAIFSNFQKWLWILSHVFGSGHKMHFKKMIFDVFMASLQMQFSQSSDHVELFLLPF